MVNSIKGKQMGRNDVFIILPELWLYLPTILEEEPKGATYKVQYVDGLSRGSRRTAMYGTSKVFLLPSPEIVACAGDVCRQSVAFQDFQTRNSRDPLALGIVLL